MADDLELPDEVFGFASWLLWLVATRATALVDRAYEIGPARPSRRYGMVDGHHLPTPSLIAWLLVAAESGIPADGLAQRSPRMDERQKVLRTLMSRAINGETHVFKDSWLSALAIMCGLSQRELELLSGSRDDGCYPVDPEALRKAIARTFQASQKSGSWPVGGVAATRALPRDIAAFTGRKAQLREVAAAVGAASGSGQAAAIYSVDGMAGVGKTAFAIHVAHVLAPRFPDGQVLVSLRAHTAGQRPVNAADALAMLLLTVGVGAAQIPPDAESRSRLWRDQIADKRLLLVLDDATGHEQIEPLLPATPESLVLVTSRRRLTALEGARAISLDVLSEEEAAELLVRLAGRPGLDARSVREITRLCGYLPLALGMLARQLHHHPAWTPADLAADLAAARERLRLMTTENLSVAASLELSYRDLTPGLKRLFRRLGLHPGSSIDAWAAAALDDTDPDAARRGLNDLYDHHLLTEPEHGRFRFHDLTREYAASLARTDPPSGSQAAAERLLDFYQHAAQAADHRLAPRSRAMAVVRSSAQPPPIPGFTAADQAIRWMKAERLNLDAAATYASQHAQPGYAIAIPAAMHAFLRIHGHWEQGLRLHHLALAAALESDNQSARAWALVDLGVLQRSTADPRAATASLASALSLFRDQRDRAGEAEALHHLGWLQYLADDYQAATTSLTRALVLYRSLGDQLGEAGALTNLGYLQYVTGDLASASAGLTQALAVYAAHGDGAGETGALNYLGLVQEQAGAYQAAAASFCRALDLCLLSGDRNGEAWVRGYLAHVQCLTGQLTIATGNLTRALELHRELGNRLGEASALNHLGLAQRLSGDDLAAISSQDQAIELYRGFGSRLGEADARKELGIARQQAGDFDEAAASLNQALEMYRELGDVIRQAETLDAVGDLLRASGQPVQARASHERALAITRDRDAPLEQARALEGIGRCHLAEGRAAEADAPLRQALAIYGQLGTPCATRIETVLATTRCAGLSEAATLQGSSEVRPSDIHGPTGRQARS